MTFSELSKELRKERGLTQIQLAEALKVSKSCIAMIEIGKNEPTANTLLRYANYFEVSTDYLLGLEDDFGAKHFSPPQKQKLASSLTQDEQNLIEDYRALAPYLQEMLRATIQTWKGTKANSNATPNTSFGNGKLA